MAFNRFATTDTSPGTLRSADGTEWMPCRLQTLDDEVGAVRPGKLPYIRPPVKFGEVDHRVSQAEQQEEDAGGNGSGARIYAWTLIAVLAAIALGHFAPEIGQFFLTVRK